MVVQSIGLITDLRSQNKNIGVLYLATGSIVEGDSGGGVYYWNPVSTTADDSFYFIQITGVATGRWVRIYAGSNIYNSNGILLSNRTVQLGGNNLTLSGTYDTIFGSDGSITVGNLVGSGTRYVTTGPTGVLGSIAFTPISSPTTRFIETFSATAGQTAINTANVLIDSYFDIFINGVRIDALSYTNTANQIVLLDALLLDDIIDVVGFSNITIYSSFNIYTTDGTLTADRTVNGGGFSLTLNPTLYLGGNVTGVFSRQIPYFNSSVVSYFAANAGIFYQNITDPTLIANYNSSGIRVGILQKNTHATFSLSSYGIWNDVYVSGTTLTSPVSGIGARFTVVRGADSSDISTNTAGRLIGVDTYLEVNRNSTTAPTTGNAYHYYGSSQIFKGIITNKFGVNITDFVGRATISQGTTITNYYGFYNLADVGWTSGGGGIITNYYGVYIDTPIVRTTGIISNRWGVYAPDAIMNHYFNGNVLVGSASDTTLAKLQVTGAIQQTSVVSSLLKTTAAGVLVAATLGTDYSVLPSQTGNTGKFLTTDGSNLSWADVVSGVSSFNTRTGAVTLTSTDVTGALGFTPQSALSLTTTGTSGAATLVGATLNIPQYSGTNIYNASGSLTSARALTLNAFNLDFIGSIHTNRFAASGRLLLGLPTEGTFLLDVNGTARVSGAMTILEGNIDSSTPQLFFKFNTANSWLIGENVGEATRNLNVYNYNTSSISLSIDRATNVVKINNLSAINTNFDTPSGGQFNLRFNGTNDWIVGENAGEATRNFNVYNQNTTSINLSINRLSGNILVNTTTDIASSLLTLSSTTKGFLPPRMTTTQRSAIASPATGLVVYQTDGVEGLYERTSTAWRIINGGGSSIGTVTSVGLSMPSAFTVASSPITSSGTIAVTALGTASQYIRGDGVLATLPTGGSGGSSVSYYLNGGTAASVGTYFQMSTNAVVGTNADFTRTGNGLISQFLTDVGDPNRLQIPAGNWNFEMFFSMSSSGGTPQFYVELLKYDGTTFTSIASSSAIPEVISGGTIIDLYLTSLAIPATTLLATDRLALRVYIVNNTGGRTATLHTQDSHLCQIITNFAGGLSALNGLTANTQYFATGTSGTDFAISSVSDTHTFNLPTASAINRGALSSADWTTFNNKVPTSRTLTINGTAYDLSADRSWIVSYSVTSVTATYSEAATSGTKILKASTAGGAFTINLPTAVGNTATIIIKKTAGSANLTIDGAGTETIDNGLTAIIRRVDESITLISDNANWLII